VVTVENGVYRATVTAGWWIPLVAAGAAVLGGLIGGWMTHLFAARRDRQQYEWLTARQDAEWRRQREDKLRDVRAQLYLDVMEFLGGLQQILAHDPTNNKPPPIRVPDLLHPVRLAARVKLYGDADFLAAWVKVHTAVDRIADADTEGDGLQLFRIEFIAETRQSVTDLQDLLREQVLSVESRLPVQAAESRRMPKAFRRRVG
jgi:hypothetical protein